MGRLSPGAQLLSPAGRGRAHPSNAPSLEEQRPCCKSTASFEKGFAALEAGGEPGGAGRARAAQLLSRHPVWTPSKEPPALPALGLPLSHRLLCALVAAYNAADIPQLCFQSCLLSPSQGPFPSPGPELQQLQPWVPAARYPLAVTRGRAPTALEGAGDLIVLQESNKSHWSQTRVHRLPPPNTMPCLQHHIGRNKKR